MRRALKWATAAVLVVVGLPLLAGGTVLAAFIFLPLPASLPQPTNRLLPVPSVVYDDQGNVIAEFRTSGSNIPVPKSQIPAVIDNAVVSSEDHNFYHEGGVSIRGTLRALYDDVVHGAAVQGGSTITQQYVKGAYTGSSRTILRKIREAILASQLSRQLSKSEILYRYVSDSYFGEGAYGVGAAAETYFRTPVSKLDASQAATLAGVLPAPSAYDPLVDLADAEARRETVLGLMHRYGYLDASQYQLAMRQRLALVQDVKPGVPVTAVFPPQQVPAKYPYFVDYLKRYLQSVIPAEELYGGGLQIQSTLDPTDEQAAQNSIDKTLAGTSPPLDMALASVEPATGYVKALVGGRDFSQSQVNLALGGCPTQPPASDHYNIEVTASCWGGGMITGGAEGLPAGSSFKVFTLAAALQQGVSLDRTYSGPPSITIGGQTFHNDEFEGGGYYSLREATWLSLNTVYVQLADQIGIKSIAQMAKAMGIESAWFSPQVHGLSYTLGVIDVSPLDMASAYGVLADQGTRVPPSPVVRVVDSSGKVLIDDTRPSGTRVLPASTAGTETEVLQGVISRGTGYPNAVINRPEAGKTGTTDSCTNAWFVGYTPQLSTAVWMGHLTTNTEPLTDVDGVPCVYGGTLPAKTWAGYMSKALAGLPPANFATPPQPVAPPNVISNGPGGLSAGYEQTPTAIGPGGTYLVQPPPPNASAPPTTTTTTTSTTVPGSPAPTILPAGPGGPGPSPPP